MKESKYYMNKRNIVIDNNKVYQSFVIFNKERKYAIGQFFIRLTDLIEKSNTEIGNEVKDKFTKTITEFEKQLKIRKQYCFHFYGGVCDCEEEFGKKVPTEISGEYCKKCKSYLPVKDHEDELKQNI